MQGRVKLVYRVHKAIQSVCLGQVCVLPVENEGQKLFQETLDSRIQRKGIEALTSGLMVAYGKLAALPRSIKRARINNKKEGGWVI